ncbi:MAG: ribosome maturation factor RimM [Solirubrobacteraceae bacterium]
MSAGERARVRAGRVGRAHGLDGSFYVLEPYESLLERGLSVEVGADGSTRKIVRCAGTAAKPILRLEGCESRTAAEGLRGSELTVAREAVAQLEEDEWWAADLEGCRVHDGETEVGTVRRLISLPSCEVLEVARERGGDLLVPLVRDAVRAVDVGEKRIEVDLAFLGEEG